MGKSLEELKAEFEARGGQVKKVPVGATCGMGASDWKRAVRGEPPRASASYITDEQRAEQAMERGREEAHMRRLVG